MNYKLPVILDGKPVEKITAFLFHDGGNDDPAVLLANSNKSFIGGMIYGDGFTFFDSNSDATPIAEMHRLIEKDPRNAERIFPYIGGEEVNSSPTHTHHRYVINFGDRKEDEARKYPDLMAIVEEKVKPSRLAQKREIRARYWWRFGEPTPALFKAISQCNRVLFHPFTSKYVTFAFLPSGMVYAAPHVIFPLQNYSHFACLKSYTHQIWVRFFGSSLEDRLRYTPSDCFETFPFPLDWETDPILEAAGKTYYDFRADLMVRHNEGLTDTYNRFHDPNELDPDILTLRQLHAECDRAVLDAYGWADVAIDCEFRLDYEDEDLEGSSKRKKPWRYRWPEAVHDEVLARLLKLNQERHQQEVRGHEMAAMPGKGQRVKGKGQKAARSTSETPTIPGMEV